MGKKRVIKKAGDTSDQQTQLAKSRASQIRKKITSGKLYVSSSYNNTLLTLSDESGNVVFQSSAGALGFRGSKKGTPYAASKAAELTAEVAEHIGMKDIQISIKGVGAGRESSIRVFAHKGFNINRIKDVTPIPHGTPRLKKPRRV